MTGRETILAMLHKAQGEPVCANVLCDAAGRRVAARIGEIRADGIAIESQDCYCARCNRSAARAKREKRAFSRVAAYRLATADSKAVA